LQTFRSLIGTLKERVRNNHHNGVGDDGVEYQEGVERRLQRPVDAGDQQPSHIGAS
jgi:hypothetical protein